MTEIVEINSGKQVVSRDEAREKGLKFFFTGVACGNGHVGERYVSNGNCTICVAERNANAVASGAAAAATRRYREVNPNASRRWETENPDRKAAKMGWNNAKARGAYLTDDFRSISDLITATVGFYAEALRLSEETGVAHEVDHRVPLKHQGLHHPGNLRVVTRAFNRSKQNFTDRECLEKILNGTWRGPTDHATISMLISSIQFDAVATGTVLQIASAETGTTLRIAA